MVSFEKNDPDLFLLNLSAADITYSLTTEDVENFLHSLGVNHIEHKETCLICPTICHHTIEEDSSMKLYYYFDHKIFRCYTECGDTMSIFELYQRHMRCYGKHVTFEEAKTYVYKTLTHEIVQQQNTIINKDIIDLDQYNYKYLIPQEKEYNTTVLDCFEIYYHPTWIHNGISIESMMLFNILYWRMQNKIIIPHYDIDDRLIGIRTRELEDNFIKLYGKYHPLYFNGTIYSHALQYNLYGINFHKNGINKRHSVIIVEAEKSVMLDHTFYGEYANAVACCGSSFNIYQLALLLQNFDINEIVLAFDKEYDDWQHPDAKKKRIELEKKYKEMTKYIQMSYIWDTENIIQKKDAPYDKGQKIFERLYKQRIIIR